MGLFVFMYAQIQIPSSGHIREFGLGIYVDDPRQKFCTQKTEKPTILTNKSHPLSGEFFLKFRGIFDSVKIQNFWKKDVFSEKNVLFFQISKN